MNKIFTSIGPKLSKQVPKAQNDIDFPCFEETIFLSDTSPDEVARVFKKMNNKKSSGYAGISNENFDVVPQ